MLKRHNCDNTEIADIIKILCEKRDLIQNIESHYDREDEILFISFEIKTLYFIFQVRDKFCICYFSLRIKDESYDVESPTPELKAELSLVYNKVKEVMNIQISLREKIEFELRSL